MVRYAQSQEVSQRYACHLCNVSRSMMGYIHQQPIKDAKLLEPMKKVASEHPAWGYRLVAAWLRNNGVEASFNRVRRLWKLHDYSALWKRKRKKIRTGELLNPTLIKANSIWCMDFLENRLENGNRFLAFVVKDEASAYCLTIPVLPSFKGEDVKQILNWLVEKYGCPEFLRCDNGGQFIAFVLHEWAEGAYGTRVCYERSCRE